MFFKWFCLKMAIFDKLVFLVVVIICSSTCYLLSEAQIIF